MEYRKAQLKPDEKACLQLRGLYEQYGYQKYKMGKFEEYSLYVENKDFLGSDKVIAFTDLDGRMLALKPDVTLSIIKNTQATGTSTEKLYYLENVYRESKESHTYKEINQMGLEYIGSIDRYALAEVVSLAAKSLRAISADYILEVSHMDFVVELLESLQVPEHTKHKLIRQIRRKNTDGIRKTAKEAELPLIQIESLCRLPFLYGAVEETIAGAREIALNSAMNKTLDQLAELYQVLAVMGEDKGVQLDLSMVNDIDYYNGIIFRGYVKELGSSILAGGQYDRAMEILGKKAGAVGFALYLNEINRIAEREPKPDVDVVLLYAPEDPLTDVAKAVAQLQQGGRSVRAEKQVPETLRYRELYRLKDGSAEKEEPSC